MDHHTQGKWFIHSPKHHKENCSLCLKHCCWLILGLVCKSDIKLVHGNLSNPFFKNKVFGQKHPMEVDKFRNSIPYINYFIPSKYCQNPVQDNQCPERAGHHRPSLLPSVRHPNTCAVFNDMSSYTMDSFISENSCAKYSYNIMPFQYNSISYKKWTNSNMYITPEQICNVYI